MVVDNPIERYEENDLEPIPARLADVNKIFHGYRDGDLRCVQIEYGASKPRVRYFLNHSTSNLRPTILPLSPRFLLDEQLEPVSVMELFIRALQLPDLPPFWREYKSAGKALLIWAGSESGEAGDDLTRLFVSSPFVLGEPQVVIRSLASKISQEAQVGEMLAAERLSESLEKGMDLMTDDLRIHIFNPKDSPDLDVIRFCQTGKSFNTPDVKTSPAPGV